MFFTIYQPHYNNKLFSIFGNKAKDLESDEIDDAEQRRRDTFLESKRTEEVEAINRRVEAGEQATETLIKLRDTLQDEADRAGGRVRDSRS